MNKDNKSTDSNDRKMLRVTSILASFLPGEYTKITPFSKKANMSKRTAEKRLYEALKWRVFWNENKDIDLIINKKGEFETIGRRIERIEKKNEK